MLEAIFAAVAQSVIIAAGVSVGLLVTAVVCVFVVIIFGWSIPKI